MTDKPGTSKAMDLISAIVAGDAEIQDGTAELKEEGISFPEEAPYHAEGRVEQGQVEAVSHECAVMTVGHEGLYLVSARHGGARPLDRVAVSEEAFENCWRSLYSPRGNWVFDVRSSKARFASRCAAGGDARMVTGELWIARVTPPENGEMRELLARARGLDVWERRADMLIVAADELVLAELERRGIGHVERLLPLAEFEERARHRAEGAEGEGST
ncbi:hypothetical protein [Saccharopolyspora elongata]|uniref:Uncharacterized protein n=1 Tax=Saccharopolyspora elongata TaxID=2530387 RepID=A0A4R4YCN7_9PSEU|nr:hypothetical protein [Saccharopolyspora elongata]TDD42438.1 hypothetical protein E1288_29385 [Saccharopolyspora elongata]